MIVVKLGGSYAASPLLEGWLDAISAAVGTVVLVPGGGPFADAVRAAQQAMRLSDAAAHDMAVMAMTQFGRALVDLRTNFMLADDEASIRNALGRPSVPVWSPWPMLRDAPGILPSWDVTSDSLSLWLALKLQASAVVLLKQVDPDAGIPDVVDAAFARFHARFHGTVCIAGPESLAVDMFSDGRLPGRIRRPEMA